MPTRLAAKTSSYEKRIVQSLRRLTQYLDTHSRQLLKNQDVTIPQVMCIDMLCEHGAMTVATLANRLHLSASTTVGIIDRLEKKAFVTRTRDSNDRRSVFVDVTKEGRAFITSAPHLLHNRLHSKMQELTEAERIQIANALERMVMLVGEDVS